MSASIAIGVAALLFTIASFWWIQVRRGRLVGFEPQAYSSFIRPSEFRLCLPLTIYNTGARTLVVVDLRIMIGGAGGIAPVIAFRPGLRPREDDPIDFAHPFPVGGRQAVQRFVEFGSRAWAPELATDYLVRVEIRDGNDRDWTELVSTTLTTPATVEEASRYITHRRNPADTSPHDV